MLTSLKLFFSIVVFACRFLLLYVTFYAVVLRKEGRTTRSWEVKNIDRASYSRFLFEKSWNSFRSAEHCKTLSLQWTLNTCVMSSAYNQWRLQYARVLPLYLWGTNCFTITSYLKNDRPSPSPNNYLLDFINHYESKVEWIHMSTFEFLVSSFLHSNYGLLADVSNLNT